MTILRKSIILYNTLPVCGSNNETFHSGGEKRKIQCVKIILDDHNAVSYTSSLKNVRTTSITMYDKII